MEFPFTFQQDGRFAPSWRGYQDRYSPMVCVG